MRKTWNVRDQTKEALEELLIRKYKEIDSEYKILRKVSNIQDAKKLLDEIWQMKSFANELLHLVQSDYNRMIDKAHETIPEQSSDQHFFSLLFLIPRQIVQRA